LGRMMAFLGRGAITGLVRVTMSVILLLSAGCIATARPLAVAVAPNRLLAACSWSDNLGEPWVDGRIVWRHISLDLLNLQSPRHKRTISLGFLGRDLAGYSSISRAVLFSRDSRYVAVVAGGTLWVVDVTSTKCWLWTKPDERVTSCCWTKDGQLAYGTVAKERGLPRRRLRKSFWLARAGQGLERRRRLYRTVAHGMDWASAGMWGDWPLDCWAPSGRYVVFVDTGHRDRFGMLDVGSGDVHHFGAANIGCYKMAWRPDGSGVFCVGSIAGREKLQVLLVSLPPIVVRDLSKRAKGIRIDTCSSRPLFWTADAKYVVDPSAGYLIRPVPWKAVKIGAILRTAFEIPKNDFPRLFFLPVPGFLGVGVLSPAAATGTYAVTYDGRERHFLAPWLGLCFTISEDGSLAVAVDSKRRMHVYRMDWSWLKTRGAGVNGG